MANILIIGGGVAGLSAGIYAQKQGHHATVCERHFVAGGNLTGWNRKGYHIDNCIHWLTGTNPNTDTYRMWEDLGALGDVGIYQAESLYTCERDGQRLSLYRDIDRFEKRMLEISPEDEKEIRSFIRVVKAVQKTCGIGGVDHNESCTVGQLLAAGPLLVKYYKMTTGDLSRRFKHPLLRDFFVSFLTEHFGAVALIFVFAHFCGDNAGLPEGGSCAMAKRMSDRFKELGGELLLKKTATKIHCEGKMAKSVTFEDGSVIEADYIIVTADPAVTFGKLLDRPMPSYLKKRYTNKRRMRFSSYQCAFACDLPEPPFRGDLTYELNEHHQFRLGAQHMVVREFSHEPSFSPEGTSILQTMTFCGEDGSKHFIDLYQRKDTYERKKEYLSDLIQKALIEKMPELDGHLTCIDVWTPATYKRFVDSEIGSYMSFAFSSGVIPLGTSNRVKGLENVILATQWLQEPGGLPIAAESGKKAIETIGKLCGAK